MKDKMEEYVEINAKLQNALNVLMVLNKERDEIIKIAENTDEITPEIQSLMDNSLQSYEVLSKYVDNLKAKADALKKD